MILAASPSESLLLDRYGCPPRALPAATPLLSEPGGGTSDLAPEVESPVHVVPRPLSPELGQRLATLLSRPHDVRKRPLRAPEDVSALVAGLPEPQRSWLQADVSALASALRLLSGVAELVGSLYVTRSDHCRKFHSDACGWRLLVTYAGPGTQWLADQAAGRVEMQHRHQRDLEHHNSALIRAGGVRQAETGDLVLLRGDLLAAEGGAIHRSPPIQAAGQARLVLKLDAPFPSTPSRPVPALPRQRSS